MRATLSAVEVVHVKVVFDKNKTVKTPWKGLYELNQICWESYFNDIN